MRVWMFLRNTENWGELSIDDLKKLNNLDDPSINSSNASQYIESINKWNKSFSLSYFEFRQRVKELAISTWRDMPIVVENIEELLDKIEDNDLVLPIDDDDWTHPEFESLADCQNEICVFKSFVFDTVQSECYEWNDSRQGFGSFNVLFKGSLLKRVDKKARMNFLKHHPNIFASARDNNADILISNNDDYMSCYVRHFGSHSRMANSPHIIGVSKQALKKNEVKHYVNSKWHLMFIEKFIEIKNLMRVIKMN